MRLLENDRERTLAPDDATLRQIAREAAQMIADYFKEYTVYSSSLPQRLNTSSYRSSGTPMSGTGEG